MTLDKSLLTNLFAGVLALIGLLPFSAAPWFMSVGLFALSGSVTNWLAIHMLFERVPGFYGSGVVPLHFEEFKRGIRKLIMLQFFSQENIDKFMQQSGSVARGLDAEIQKLVNKLDLEKAFDALLDVIMASSFGTMLGMFGGKDALNSLREPFVRKMRDSRLLPMKGVARGAALVGLPTAVDMTAGGKKLRRGVRVYSVVGGIAKLEFYNNLRKGAALNAVQIAELLL